MPKERLYVFILILLTFSTIVYAQSTQVHVNPSHTIVHNHENNTFTISIKINTTVEVYAAELKLFFNSSVVRVVNISEGDFLIKDGADTFLRQILLSNETLPNGTSIKSIYNLIVNSDNIQGTVSFVNTRVNIASGVSGTGSIMNIKLQPVNRGSGSFNIRNLLLSDSNGNDAANMISDGTVDVRFLGDVSGDCKVDLTDLILVARGYNSVPGSISWNEANDVIKNNKIDLADLIWVARKYRKTC